MSVAYNPAYKRWHQGLITLTADSAQTNQRYYLVKFGSDQYHQAITGAATDKPLGVALDEPPANYEGTISLPGVDKHTRPGVSGSAINYGDDVYSYGGGLITNAAGILALNTAGVYWKVGKALTPATAAGQFVEVAWSDPRAVVVLAALTGTANTDLTALATALSSQAAELMYL